MSAKKISSRGKRPVSGKKTPKKEEVEDPTISQLRSVNEDLLKQNAVLQESIKCYHNKLQVIIQHVFDTSGSDFNLENDAALIDIPELEITSMITNLTIAPSNTLHNYEVRLEELETRVTHLSTELAKLVQLKMKVEKELNDMQRMHTVEELKVSAKRLWYECCSTHVFVSSVDANQNGFTQPSVNETSRLTSAVENPEKPANPQGLTQETIPALYLSVLSPRAQSIVLIPGDPEGDDLIPPEQKMPGETHIFNMHVGLRSLIIRDLSKQRGNANDWRLMATRVGIPDNLIEHWIKMRAPNAMALVMKVWGDSIGATVRMLHRHLVSPQMKSLVLAKRISDFYVVD